MKLSARDAARFLDQPDKGAAGVLLFGADPMRVALKRAQLVAALVGPNGEDEMRLTRIAAADLRKDPASLIDAMRAQGFFSGPRVVLVEDAGDGLSSIILPALQDWREGDAQLVVTAGALPARSSLRKGFEASANAVSIGVYDDPPSQQELQRELQAAGVGEIDSGAMQGLVALSRTLDPGDFRQTVQKLALYKHGDPSPATAADLEAVAPLTAEAELDDLLNAVAEGRRGEIGPLMGRLTGQGIQPVGFCIGAMRHFRTLLAAASDRRGPESGIARVRPPVFGPRRDRMIRQARHWGAARLEQAVQILIETDLALRSSTSAPQSSLVERAFIRLAMMGAR